MSIRITDSYMASILLGDLNRGLGNLLEQQRMAGSMRRINSFADDPRAIGTIQEESRIMASVRMQGSSVTSKSGLKG